MIRRLAGRALQGLVLLPAVALLSFVLAELAPGDFFADMRLDPRMSEEHVRSLRARHGLDRPLPERYARWLGSLARGELGFSFAYGQPVGPLLWPRARNSLLLNVVATAAAWLLAIPLGVFWAHLRSRGARHVFAAATAFLLAVPDVVFALALLLLAVRTGWFPAGGMVSLGHEQLSWGARVVDVARHLALPAIALVVSILPVLVRHVRAAVADALEAPFVRVARAHGLSEARVLFRHALPAAANPLVSLFGLSLAGLLSMSLLVEVVMGWPGLGPLMLEAILARDLHLVVGPVLVSTVFLLLGNLAGDLMLMAVDPRIRSGGPMKVTRGKRMALGLLAAVHLAALAAGFLAPYSPVEQNRTMPYAPPTRVHIIDDEGRFHARPFVYATFERDGVPGAYEEDRTRRYPVRFLVNGAPYTLAGMIRARTHLFGVEEPARLFLLGADGLGRDQLSRLLHGAQVSLAAGLLATALSLGLGWALGTFAGFYGGWVDAVVMRGADLFLALPWLYLLLAVRAAMPLHVPPAEAFLMIVLVIGIVDCARPARLIRGVALSARERNFVLAARGFGASDLYLVRRHIAPHTLGLVFTQAAVLIPQYVLAEITLSFLGLGVSEPAPSWGNMLAALQQYHVLSSYWWMWIPGLALVPVFLAYFVLSEGVSPAST